jgi:hypothetical protein
VREVKEDRKLGLVAVLAAGASARDDAAVGAVLGQFTTPWSWD